jgi:hypothetical protein
MMIGSSSIFWQTEAGSKTLGVRQKRQNLDKRIDSMFMICLKTLFSVGF